MMFLLPWKFGMHNPCRTTTSCNCHMTALKNQARYDEVVNVMWQLCVDEKYPFPDKISYNILIDALGRWVAMRPWKLPSKV